jgi:hypothetical protein
MAGEDLKMGSGKESKQISMSASGELHSVFGFTSNHVCMQSFGKDYGESPEEMSNDDCSFLISGYEVNKVISIDNNGVETVSFYDEDGKIAATCLSGKENELNVMEQYVSNMIPRQAGNSSSLLFTDIHLPAGCEGTVGFEFEWLGYNNDIHAVDIIDLMTNTKVGTATPTFTPVLSPGFYRLINQSVHNTVRVNYVLNYYNFSLYYYDLSDRLVKIVPPNSIDTAYIPNIEHTRSQDGHTPSYYSSTRDNNFDHQTGFTMPVAGSGYKQYSALSFFVRTLNPVGEEDPNYPTRQIKNLTNNLLNEAKYTPGRLADTIGLRRIPGKDCRTIRNWGRPIPANLTWIISGSAGMN